MTDHLLTVAEVAERLRVTPSTVSLWARDGLIRAIRLPSGRLRFRAADIDQLVASTDSN
jgi:excisionase family DNA binding protein